MSLTRRTIALGFALALAFAADAFAQTRTETLRWTHPDPSDVVGFEVHYGPSSRSYTTTTDVALPPVLSGAYEVGIEVDADADVYFAVTAYSVEAASFFSNERCRGPAGPCDPPSQPSPPSPPDGGSGGAGSDPPPSPDGPRAAINGFALWDAASDSRVDASFTSGEQISLAELDCAAIEILGNSYLSRSSSPGSLMYAFDGQTPSACNDPGTSHENNPPYAWEADSGPGRFECAPTLTQPGTHTLTVTPFDGDDCSGQAGTPVTLTFEVVDPSAPPPPAAAIGRPGKPVLVVE